MELLRALGTLAEPPAASTRRVWASLEIEAPEPSDFTDLFVFQLPPYASIYVGSEGMLGGEARSRIGDFWRALGAEPPAEPDHLAALLGLYASLAERDGMRTMHARTALLHEHLLSWLPAYLMKAEEIAAPAYRAWAALLREALAAEAARLPARDRVPLHLRDAPPLDDPRTGGAAAFVAGMLAPARSGLLIVRDDLARAAHEMGLAQRAGERRFILAALFDQDPFATLRWLAAEARRWESRHADAAWSARARTTANLVEGMLATAGAVR